MALGKGEARHIWQWSTRDSTQGMVKIQKTKQDKIQQLVNQRGLYVLVKEAVVPKEFEIFKEEDIAVGLQGRYYVQIWQFGVFYPTEVAHRVFPSPNCRVFLHIKYKFFPL
jgi:hypothetical protein